MFPDFHVIFLLFTNKQILNLLDLVYLKYFKIREVKPDINQRKEKLEKKNFMFV